LSGKRCEAEIDRGGIRRVRRVGKTVEFAMHRVRSSLYPSVKLKAVDLRQRGLNDFLLSGERGQNNFLPVELELP